jgi:tetratricopeptide (TPR) repeat protein
MRHTARSGKIIAQVIFILFITVASLSLALFLAKSGPQRVERVRRDTALERTELRELREKSRALWDRFISVSEYRPKLTDEDVNILKEALGMRETYLQRADLAGLASDPDMIIEDMRKKWAEIQATKCREEARVLQVVAEAARDKGDYATAAEKFAQALALENKISDEFSLSRMRDTTQVAYLSTEVKRANGRPVWESTQRLEEEGEKLFAEKKWEEAEKKYDESLKQQEIVSLKFPGLFETKYLRADTLRARRDTAASGPEQEQILVLIANARELAAAAKYDEAEKVWNTIQARYDEMRRLHPRCDYVQEAVTEVRNKERDQLLSVGRVNAVIRRIGALDESLRSGATDSAGSEALLILQESERILKKYPNASVFDAETRRKLNYISVKSSEIAGIQQSVAGMLKPVPGIPDVLLLNIEVPQTLYTTLLDGHNPSAVVGDFLPVDSVAYEEALNFCKHFGWLIGRPVRLPTEAEFRNAVGTVERAALPGQAWAFENSGNAPHKGKEKAANANGFFDLLGNLSEWGQAPRFSDNALVFGGSYQNSFEALALVPSEQRPKHDKNRLRGFRIVVETGPQPAAK